MTHDELYAKALVTIPPHKQAELKALVKAIVGSMKSALQDRDRRIVELQAQLEKAQADILQLQTGVKAAANLRPFPAAGARA
jgi:hypothetical protein